VPRNVAVEIVDITDADNRTTTVYFNQITKLPVRQVFQHRDPETREVDEEVTVFSKYREVAGTPWPWAMSAGAQRGEDLSDFSGNVQINRPLKEKLFELPSGMQVLKAE
jgi:hypothetical protein